MAASEQSEDSPVYQSHFPGGTRPLHCLAETAVAASEQNEDPPNDQLRVSVYPPGGLAR